MLLPLGVSIVCDVVNTYFIVLSLSGVYHSLWDGKPYYIYFYINWCSRSMSQGQYLTYLIWLLGFSIASNMTKTYYICCDYKSIHIGCGKRNLISLPLRFSLTFICSDYCFKSFLWLLDVHMVWNIENYVILVPTIRCFYRLLYGRTNYSGSCC